MTKRLFILALLACGLIVGCGDSDNFSGSTTNVTQVINDNGLSGLTGQVQVNTNVAAQTIEIIESDTIPEEVDELRFTGYQAGGFPIYSNLKPKATVITLENVPIEVVNLRVELLADGLIVGGYSTPVTVEQDETTIITDPVFLFPDIEPGPPGPVGPTGPDGPEGPTGPVATSDYGSFATADGDFQSLSETGGEGTNRFLDLPRIFASEGVARVGALEGEETAVYQVTTGGDYLVTYAIENSEGFIPQGTNPKLVFLVFSAGDDPDDLPEDSFFWNFNFFTGGRQTLQLIVSLDAGDSIALGYDNDGAGGEPNFAESTLSVVRIGPDSGSSLPDSTPPDNEGD